MPFIVALGLALATAVPSTLVAHPVIGDAAPPLPQEGVRAQPDASAEAPITIVEFFATWCAACQASLRDTVAVLNKLDQGPGTSRFKLVIVDVGEDVATVKRWLSKSELFRNTTLALDADKSVYARWGANRLPTVFVIDKLGIIRHINRGHGKGYPARLTAWLRKRLAATQEVP